MALCSHFDADGLKHGILHKAQRAAVMAAWFLLVS